MADVRALTAEEVAAGYIRPLRDRYTHGRCGKVTVLTKVVADSFARLPGGFGKIWCAACRGGFRSGPDGDFTWVEDGSKVGT